MLTDSQLIDLCRKWERTPWIVRGIVAAHRERGGKVPNPCPGYQRTAVDDIFETVFGGRK